MTTDSKHWALMPEGKPKWVATDAVEEADRELHYSVVVLRDDQIDRIARRVVELLSEERNTG